MQIQSFINSTFQSSKTHFVKKNPYTNDSYATCDSADLMQAVQSIHGAQKAFLEFSKSTWQQRITLLDSIQQQLIQNKIEFAKLEALDQGLPLTFTQLHNLDAAIGAFQQAKDQLHQMIQAPLLDQMYSANGVVVIVASWNLSLRIISERLAPALAAGNSVIIKVSSMAPASAFILGKIFSEIQLPAGLVQVLITDQVDVKELLISHPGVKAVSIAGQLKTSSDVLKKVSSQSLNQFKKIQIASGSKNSAIVLIPVQPSEFKHVMKTFLLGQGQLAWNSSRLFILEKHESEWVEAIQNLFNDLKPAESIDDESVWTPCLKPDSFKQFSEIESLAQTDKAHLLQPQFQLSTHQKHSYLKPTFTKDMSNCSTLQQDQVLAPLFILSVVKYPFDIAKYSNVSYYGQSASIWAEDSKILKISEQLDVATIYKNKWSVEVHQPNLGVKQSGYGLQDYQVFGAFYSNVKKLT